MSWFVNDPPRWLARALAIVNGNAPTQISNEIVPVADVMQGGWGDITWSFQFMAGAIGSVTQAAIVSADVNNNHIVSCSFDNGDTAASLITLDLTYPNFAQPVVMHKGSVAAGGFADNKTILGGGSQFLLVPAGYVLRATIPPATTTAPTWSFHIGRAPVGTKLL